MRLKSAIQFPNFYPKVLYDHLTSSLDHLVVILFKLFEAMIEELTEKEFHKYSVFLIH